MNKDSAQIALVKLELQDVIELLNKQANYKLRDVEIKQLEGMEAEDFVQLTILKVLDGTRDWEKSTETNMLTFLRRSLNSEISNYIKHLKRRNIQIDSADEDLKDNYDE